MPHALEVMGVSYRLDEPIGSGYKSVVWRVRDPLGKPRALKLATAEDYEGGPLAEALRAAPLAKYRELFAELYGAESVVIDLGELGEIPLVAFVQELVDGETLGE